MARQVTPTRKARSIRDANLKRLSEQQKAKIKKQRKAFREKVKRQQERTAELTNKQDGKRQNKLTANQAKRRETQIRRNIATRKRLKYQVQGGSIEYDVDIKSNDWQNNFASSNVWKFKVRGKNLLVAFLDGSVYIYYGAAKMFLGMIATGSKGKYVWKQFRRKGVPYLKII